MLSKRQKYDEMARALTAAQRHADRARRICDATCDFPLWTEIDAAVVVLGELIHKTSGIGWSPRRQIVGQTQLPMPDRRS